MKVQAIGLLVGGFTCAFPASAQTPAEAPSEKPRTEIPTSDATTSPTSDRASASADAMNRGRTHFSKGIEYFRASNFEGALEEFLRAQAAAPSARISYNLAQTYMELRRPVEALNAFRAYLKDGSPTLDAQRRASVVVDMERLQKEVVRLYIASDTKGVELLVDETSVGTTPFEEPIFIAPGPHKVVGRVAGEAPHVLTVEGGAGQELRITLTFTPSPRPAARAERSPETPPRVPQDPPPEPSHSRFHQIAVPTGLVLTGAFAVATGAFAALTAGAHSDFEQTLNRFPVTNEEVDRKRDTVHRWALTTDLLAAGALITGGATLYLIVSAPSRPPPVTVGVRGTGVSVEGSF